MITIAGGVYRERCMCPAWDYIYGSAGRAAAALAIFGGDVELHACVDEHAKDIIKTRAIYDNFIFNPTVVSGGVTFEYIHGLSNPHIQRDNNHNTEITIRAENVLRFGMIDGTAIIDANYAVFDPQNSFKPESFHDNGSKAKHLALVLNYHEAKLLAPSFKKASLEELAVALSEQEGAEVIVIKMGPQGAVVYENSTISTVPAFKTKHVWKIGSGDTFAAHFAMGWMEDGLSAHEAAQTASIATAFYCENKGFPDRSMLKEFSPSPLLLSEKFKAGYVPQVYLAGPFFTLAELWMIGQARRDLQSMGLKVLSPYHDIGLGSAADVVQKDLEGIRDCDIVLAIGDGLDSGTIYEIGYARALNKPVVFYSENESEHDKKMMTGSSCCITDDYVSAIYQTVWNAITS